MNPDLLIREGRLVGRSREGDVATVELAVESGCASCRSRCLVGSASEQRITLDVPRDWRPGTGGGARMGVSRSALNHLCASVFGIPLGSWLVGGVVGSHFWGEAGGVLLGAALLAGSLLAALANRRSLRRWVKLELIALRPVAVDRLSADLGPGRDRNLKWIEVC